MEGFQQRAKIDYEIKDEQRKAAEEVKKEALAAKARIVEHKNKVDEETR